MSQIKDPIILVGNVRSGTTMTSLVFGQFDDIVIWDEPRTVWTMGNAEIGHDRFTDDLATPKVIDRIRKALLRHQQRHGDRRVMEKTPSNCLRVPFITRVFPEARFLHVVRDGRDNVSSCLRWWTMPINRRRMLRRLRETPVLEWPMFLPRFLHDRLGHTLGLVKTVQSWGVVYPGMYEDLKRMRLEEVVATQWVQCVETAQADFKHVDPELWIEYRYEDFVASPVEHVERFAAHTGLQITPRVIEYIRKTIHHDGMQVWRKRLTAEQVALITPILRPTMERLGYRLDEPASPVAARA